MRLLSIVFLTLISFAAMGQSQYLKVAGDWEGSISVQETDIKVVFHIKYDGEALSATMDSPDQNAFGIKVDEVSFKEGILKMKSNQVQGDYEGTLNNNTVDGKWKLGQQTFDLKLSKKVKKRSS
ncbi:MAG: hypothetical protein HEP71_08535 [Roseivirga sp.]|nr:hypothetical protein [Roseivirga sp.]